MSIVRDIITDALAEIGVIQASEVPTAGDAQLALVRLQHMIDGWAADRLTLSVLLRTLFTMTPSTSTFTIGISGADVLLPRPVWINQINYLIPGSSPAVEVVMAQLDEDSYAALSIKALPNTLPTSFFYNTSISTVLGTVFVWPQVTGAVTLAMYWPQALDVPLSLNSVIIAPPGYQEALMYQLAVRLCRPFGVALTSDLQDLATKAFATMKRPNVSPGLLSVDAALVPQFSKGFNILTGETNASNGR